MSQIVVEMSSEEAKLYQGIQSIISQQAKMERGFTKIASSSRQAGREAAQLARQAKRVYEETRTPQERYNRKLEDMQRLLEKNKISHDTYRRAAAQAKDELLGVQQAGTAAFGATAISQLTTFAAGFLSVSNAVGTVTSALNEMQAVRAQSAQKARESRMGMGSLAQVANSPEEMKQLTKKAEDLYAGGGAASKDEAARVVFAIKSAGSMDQFELFKEMRATGLVESPDIMARAATTLLSSMGEEETGSIRDLVSKAFGASAYSPATAEAILEASARSGGTARALGYSDESVLAGTAVMSKTTGSAEIGGTALSSLLDSLDEKGDEYRGMTLPEAIKKLKAKGLEGEELQKYLGRKEAVRAYRDLSQNMDLFLEARGSVERAQANDEIGRKLGYYKVDPSLVAARDAESSQAELENERKTLGTYSNVADTILNKRETRRMKMGVGEFANWGERKLEQFARWWQGDVEFVQSDPSPYARRRVAQIEADRASDGGTLEAIRQDLADTATAQKEAAAVMKEAAETMLRANTRQGALAPLSAVPQPALR